MRIAFIDLMFAWPPQGGAQIDLYHLIKGLQSQGHEVRLFAAAFDDMWRSTGFVDGDLPFPSTLVHFEWASLSRRNLQRKLWNAVAPWSPELIFAGFSRYFKPYIIEALSDYPVISRYYMYEPLCPRDFCLYKDYQRCANDFLRTPNICRKCTLACRKDHFQATDPKPYAKEIMSAGALTPEYHRLFTKTLAQCRAAIVYNQLAKDRLEGYCPRIEIIPGGVTVADYPNTPLHTKPKPEVKVILMPGRADDELKGLDVLVDAAQGLAQFRDDFQLWVTLDEDPVQQPWFQALPWRSPKEVVALYEQADIVVIPSVWEEPFGLVAVEAMAAGRPVVASRVGGLQHIVREEETGLLFEAESSAELAFLLERLLDSAETRCRLGATGRIIAEEHYDWEHIINTYYPPLLEWAVS